MIARPQGADIEITYEAGVSGLLATARFRIEDGQGNVVLASQAFDAEIGSTGVYTVTVAGIGTVGQYVILATPDGTYDPEGLVSDQLVIYEVTNVPSYPPLPPLAEDGVSSGGPCSAWTSADAVAACCTTIDDGTDTSVLDSAIIAASQALYALSGEQFSGTCEALVRPCSSRLGCERRYPDCGCYPVDRIPLAGRVREILEVKIDGEVVDPATYRVEGGLWLVRQRDETDLDTHLGWPSCQDMRLPLGAKGTFGILYTYGVDPPAAGIAAAGELACAIYQACEGDLDSCALPAGITQVTRQGVTMSVQGFLAWGLTDGIWRTGMPLVDLFLNAANPHGRSGRAQVWSPYLWRYPSRVSTGS